MKQQVIAELKKEGIRQDLAELIMNGDKSFSIAKETEIEFLEARGPRGARVTLSKELAKVVINYLDNMEESYVPTDAEVKANTIARLAADEAREDWYQ